MAGTLTSTAQDVWPPRRQLTITGLGDDTFTIYRVVGGNRTALRAAEDIYIYPTTVFAVIDAEMPFGIPITYQLVEDGVDGDTDGPHTITLPGGMVAVTDAISALAAEVAIGAIDDLTGDAAATVYPVDGINRVVSDRLSKPQTTVEYLTTTITARDQLREVLRLCTSGIFQQRGPTQDYDADAYYAVLGSSERRFSQDGTDPRRITAVTVAEVPSWAAALEARGYTYEDLEDVYTGQGYDDLAGDYATYFDLVQADLG